MYRHIKTYFQLIVCCAPCSTDEIGQHRPAKNSGPGQLSVLMCCNCCDWAQLLRVWGIAHLCGESSQQSVQLESLIRHSATHRDHDCIQSKVEESRPPHLIRSGPITGLATVLTKLGGVRPSFSLFES